MKHSLSVAILSGLLVLGAAVIAVLILLKFDVLHVANDSRTVDSGGDVVDATDDGDGVDSSVSAPVVSASGNVVITSPTVGETIGLPLTITGEARVFENTFNYRLLDQDGSVLVEGNAMAKAADVGLMGDYTITTTYPTPTGVSGTVEVFDYSAKDGSVVDLARVAVVFPQMATMDLKEYWTTADSATDCGVVAASMHRVAKSVATAHAAIVELLKGPDATDVARGFGTSIPAFVTLKSISIEGGVAKVEFNSNIEVGGSCRMQSIRAQIESTLKQFPTVTSVIITSEGRTAAESLQP
jgi:hypothetical protein